MRIRPALTFAVGILVVLALGAAPQAYANGLTITPVFDSSITGNAQAAAIEADINTAIGTLEALYNGGTSTTYSVEFSYTPGAPGNLLSTSQYYYNYSYASYVGALAGDAAANPGNTNLATALANLGKGNSAGYQGAMILPYADALMLANYGLAPPSPPPAIASVNINSNAPFAITGPAVYGSTYDLIGGLEHELDETMGGGGGGSTINNFYGEGLGPTDLYRYSAPASVATRTAELPLPICRSMAERRTSSDSTRIAAATSATSLLRAGTAWGKTAPTRATTSTSRTLSTAPAPTRSTTPPHLNLLCRRGSVGTRLQGLLYPSPAR